MRQNVGHLERVVSVAAGLALVGAGFRHRRKAGAVAATGVGLLARGIGGYCPVNQAIGRELRNGDTREVLGGSGGVRLRARIAIDRPRQDVYRFWRHLSNLPEFMGHLERVEEMGYGRSHWVMSGPAGVPVSWDAELINEIEPKLLAWRSMPGSDLVSAGSVRFDAVSPWRTEVIVTMQYEPPAGAVGSAVGWLAGFRPANELGTDLRRLKKLLENRRGVEANGSGTPTHEMPRPF